MRRLFLTSGSVILVGLALIAATPRQGGSPDKSTEAARLNNLGAAYMNQQLFEKGLKAFQDAAALDPKLEIARLNQGIALLNLTRIDQAKQLLEEAVKKNPMIRMRGSILDCCTRIPIILRERSMRFGVSPK